MKIQQKEYSYNLRYNMQYYMEYCYFNGYVTPEEWLNNHKHYEDVKESINYTEEEVVILLEKFLNLILSKMGGESTISMIDWFNKNKKK